MSFAALEVRTNAAAFAKLANVTATVSGGVAIPGIFDKPYAEFGMVAGNKPVLKLLESDAPSVAENASITVSGQTSNFKVSGEPQRDGVGVVTLELRVV